MEIVNVLVAAAASWVFGALWYMALAKPWMEAAGIETDETGKPKNAPGLMPFILSAICMLLVAGMMRHMLGMAGIASVGKSVLAGLGIGLFFISPWIMINNAYSGRPFRLTMIDGGYAVFWLRTYRLGIGAVLTKIGGPRPVPEPSVTPALPYTIRDL